MIPQYLSYLQPIARQSVALKTHNPKVLAQLMISIIICSRSPHADRQLKDNIAATIGTNYELIYIDNSQSRYNIFEAYNEGVSRSRGDVLCFMHEDLCFHSKDWGLAVERLLSLPHIDALGLAGCTVITKDVDWRFYPFNTSYLIQGDTSIEPAMHYYINQFPTNDGTIRLESVATIDGCWMCFKKELFEKISFDDQTFHDFHMYDTDICMQINQLGKNIFITNEIVVEHFSLGTFSEGFKIGFDAFCTKWSSVLPFRKNCKYSNENIESATPEAQKCFENRLREDSLKTKLNKVFRESGHCKSFSGYTTAEKALIDWTSYRARLSYIRGYYVSRKLAWDYMLEYMKRPFAKHRTTLVFKFIKHRVFAKSKKYNASRNPDIDIFSRHGSQTADALK